jgi:hypothetical protein
MLHVFFDVIEGLFYVLLGHMAFALDDSLGESTRLYYVYVN